jgi:hypothetical protein
MQPLISEITQALVTLPVAQEVSPRRAADDGKTRG